MENVSATFLGHEECPKCGSADNLGRWSDGHAHCFGASCNYFEPPSDGFKSSRTLKVARDLLPWRYSDDMLWGVIHPDTAKMHRYGMSVEPYWTPSGKTVKGYHVANYCNREGEVVAQKLRFANKGVGLAKNPGANYFPWVGPNKDVVPLGFSKWRKGKRLLIVEGEKDFLAACQIFENKWPVWSLINGAQSAAQDLAKLLPDLEAFEEVILMFDSDEAGQVAQQACAEKLMGSVNILLAPALPLKDTAEMLIAKRASEWIRSYWDAAPYRPKQIVTHIEALGRLKERRSSGSLRGAPYPWLGLSTRLLGALPGQIVTIVAGSGTGKSTVCRHLLRHFHETTDDKVAGVFLEEDVDETFAGILSIGIGKNILTRNDVTNEEIEAEASKLFANKGLALFEMKDEALNADGILSQIRFMAKGLGCRYIFLDHLSFVVGGMEITDERKAIDVFMTKLRKLVKSTGITLFNVVHLKRPDGNKGYDEGLKVSTNFIRGSQSVEQISNVVLALQRNKRDPDKRDYLEVVVLKNRTTGDDGCTACWLRYDRDSGTLSEVSEPHASPFDGLEGAGIGEEL